MISVQKIYNALPYSLKVLAASAKGYSIASWRYGPELGRLVAEAEERESWGHKHWGNWQEERLVFLLDRAARRVPYYRDYWLARRRGGDKAPWDVLENWPILEKQALRSVPKAFLADDCNPKKMQHWQTSGSTGTPLNIWWSRESMRSWYALFEGRWRRWHRVNLADRWAILGGKLITPVQQKRPPFWVWNQPMHQLYMSAYHLSPANIPAYLSALWKYRIVYLYGYSSALHSLAQGVLDAGLDAPRMKVALTNAEPLFDNQRSTIEEAFHCPVRETYSMAEAVAAAGECEMGQMHIWPEAGCLEFLENGNQVEPGETGDIVSTGLINQDLPLVRYRIGDRGIRPDGRICKCGRSLPVLPAIEGRCDDIVITSDGRRVGRLDPIFKADFRIRAAQIIQEDIGRFLIKIIPAQGYDEHDSQEIASRLHERVGHAEVKIELVEAIPLGANGKFRAVVSRLTKQV